MTAGDGRGRGGSCCGCGGGRKLGEPKHDALRFFQQGVADQHFGHGIFAAALLELGLARHGAIGAHLAVDPQHAAARPKVVVLHHGPIHSDDIYCWRRASKKCPGRCAPAWARSASRPRSKVPQLPLVPLGEYPPRVAVRAW